MGEEGKQIIMIERSKDMKGKKERKNKRIKNEKEKQAKKILKKSEWE